MIFRHLWTKYVTERNNNMRVLVDTNVLFSALVFPHSKPAQVLLYIADNHEIVLCDRNIVELRDILKRKYRAEIRKNQVPAPYIIYHNAHSLKPVFPSRQCMFLPVWQRQTCHRPSGNDTMIMERFALDLPLGNNHTMLRLIPRLGMGKRPANYRL